MEIWHREHHLFCRSNSVLTIQPLIFFGINYTADNFLLLKFYFCEWVQKNDPKWKALGTPMTKVGHRHRADSALLSCWPQEPWKVACFRRICVCFAKAVVLVDTMLKHLCRIVKLLFLLHVCEVWSTGSIQQVEPSWRTKTASIDPTI